jgi:hypothetical protein
MNVRERKVVALRSMIENMNRELEEVDESSG